MPLVLHVDAARWRAHQDAYVAGAGGPAAVVPVVKGNGYGPGAAVVAREAARLGVPRVAVGTYDELPLVARAAPDADLLVLTPWRPGVEVPHAAGSAAERVVHTVSRLVDLRALAERGDRPRVVLEVLTSMRRHGIAPAGLAEVAPLLGGVVVEGWALHLPLSRHDPVGEASRLGERAVEVLRAPLWVSHVPSARLGDVARATGVPVRLRGGTGLWLGDRAAMRWAATVLDVHRLARGESYGYRQRTARSTSTLLVAAGGTSHGIGLEGPNAGVTVRQRAVTLARGALAAAGRVRSPYRLDGRVLAFAEPPHMQCSMLWVPGDGAAPDIGAELDVAVRYTTTVPDEVHGVPVG